MPRTRTRAGRHSRTSGAAFAVALLVLALALVAVLAYKAQAAARSHRETAERTLRDYATFASWEFIQRARMNLLTQTISSFAVSMSRINPDYPDDSLPTPGEVWEVARRRMAWCGGCLDSAHFFFRYSWRTGELLTAGAEPSAAVRRWVRDTVVAHQRLYPAPKGLEPVPFGGAPSRGPVRRLSVILTNDAYINVFDTVEGRDRVLAYVLFRTAAGEPVATFGFESDATAFARPAMRNVLERQPLLPPSLVGDLRTDAIVGVAVGTLAGAPLYASSAQFPLRYAAVDTLEPELGRLVTRLAISPAIADQLLVGGLPRSQLPLLLGLFVLTAGLVAGALVQLRRQEELARLRTDFVSGVSHELRTPLTQIRLFTELLHAGTLRSEDERRRALPILDQEARRLTYLVENVLSFSRAERDANRISPEPAEVDAEARDTLEMFAPVAQARGVRLSARLESGAVAPLDRGAFRQILLNLLDNAVKYGPAAQTVTLATARVGDTVRAWVEDQGLGIPLAERERVWEPYHRLERDAVTAVGGSGIGLAVVRDLVALHGGRAWVEGVPGGAGARVVVELPAAAPHAPAWRAGRVPAAGTTSEGARA